MVNAANEQQIARHLNIVNIARRSRVVLNGVIHRQVQQVYSRVVVVNVLTRVEHREGEGAAVGLRELMLPEERCKLIHFTLRLRTMKRAPSGC